MFDWKPLNYQFVRILLILKNLPDSKRQQTITVDYKRLFNGFVLTGFAFLRHKKYKNEKYSLF
jgi:hypothetical protein